MILEISPIKKHPKLKDFCWIEVKRKEPEVNNNQVYIQKVLGSYKSVKWYRNQLTIKKFKEQQK